MMLLPKKVGPFTLMRRLGSDGVTESFVGILDEPAGKQVLVHRLLPWIVRDSARLAAVEARVNDLTGIRHPVLVPVIDYVDTGDDRFVVEEWVDAVDLDRVLAWCRENRRTLPHNIYLNLATQVCNGLEALHGRPGKASGAENVLHLGLQPNAVLLTPEGKLVLGGYGLVRSPTSLPHGGADIDGRPPRMEYLSPEQTHPDQKLTPASDIFALGTILYELLTLEALFRAESNLQTIHRVRRAEVTTPLLRVKEILPGLDKVLYRALSLNPRHRYQRAFVLREDLRGLMSGFSFSRIADETRDFLAPLFEARSKGGHADAPRELSVADAPQPSNDPLNESTAGILAAAVRDQAAATARRDDPDDTAALIRRAQQRRDRSGNTLVPSDDMVASLPPTPTPPAAHASSGAARTPEARPAPPVAEVRPEAPRPAPEPPPPANVGEDTQWLSRSAPEPQAPPQAPVDPSLTMPPAPMRDPSARSMPPQAPLHQESKTSWTKRGSLTPEPVPRETAPPPPPNEFDDERPTSQTDVKQVPPDSSPRPALSAPPPKALAYDDPWADDAPKRSNLGLFLGVAAVGVVLVGAVACLGVGGLTVAGWSGGAATTTVVDGGEPAPAPVPEAGAVPDAGAVPEADAVPATAAPPPTGATDADPASASPSTAAPKTVDSPTAAADPAPRAAPPATTRTSSSVARAAASPFEEPRPARATYTPSAVEPSPARAAAPTTSDDSRSRQAAVAAFDVEPPAMDSPEDDGLAEGLDFGGDMATYAQKARDGGLSDGDKRALDELPSDDPDYARAKILVYEDAKARGDDGDKRRALKAAMAVPENQYNPALLAEEAALAIADGEYEVAIARADLAERHWQRLPSDLIFTRKAMIYEAQAAGWQGVFYQSGGDDFDALQNAIRCWQKYQRHVETRSRGELARKADEQLAKLYDMQRRLE